MRKIRMKRDVEKTRKRNTVLIGIILIGLMILSTAGYSLIGNDDEESDSSTNEYNGFKFIRQRGLWRTSFSGLSFGFQYLPEEVENVSVSGSYDLNLYSGAPLYFVNPDSATSEILNNLGGYILRWQEACLEGEDCEGDLPVKNCDENLIILGVEPLEENVTRVYQNESCVFISGDSVKGADAFLYKVLKIS
jgi:hypothetical protein